MKQIRNISGWALVLLTLSAAVNPTFALTIWHDDFSSNQGWTSVGATAWERGKASRSTGCTFGQDPGQDHSASSDNFVLGYSLGSCTSATSFPATITSPVIDCSSYSTVRLGLYRWLGIAEAELSTAEIQALHGETWTTIWVNPQGAPVLDEAWRYVDFDVSPYAAHNASFKLAFVMKSGDTSRTGCGWNIDDLIVYSPESYCLEVTPRESYAGAYSGAAARHTFSIFHCGTTAESYFFEVVDADWPTAITDAEGNPITELTIASTNTTVVYVDVTAGQGFDEAVLVLYDHQGAERARVSLATASFLRGNDFSTDPTLVGWSGFTANQWEWGAAQSGETCQNCQDPGADHSPSADNRLIGYNLGGCYQRNAERVALSSPLQDFTDYVDVHVTFWRHLGMGFALTHKATLEAVIGSNAPLPVWAFTGYSACDQSWVYVDYDLGNKLDNSSNGKLLFTMGPTGSASPESGWNLDDLAFYGFPAAALQGVVSDNRGAVPYATVTIRESGNTTTAQADGGYLLKQHRGRYTVLAEARGHNPETVEHIVLAYGETTLLNIELKYPELEIDPLAFEFTVNLGGSTEDNLDLLNSGNGYLEFSLATDVDWLTIYPVSGTIPAAGSIPIDVTVAAIPAQVGPVNLGSIVIKTNDGDESQLAVPVTLLVPDAPSPTPSFEPTPVPTPLYSISISMDDYFFIPGDPASLAVTIDSPHSIEATTAVLVAAFTTDLEHYWFYPSWYQFPPHLDFEPITIKPDSNRYELIPPFYWPSIGSEFGEGYIFAIVLNPELSVMLSPLAMYNFGWGPWEP